MATWNEQLAKINALRQRRNENDEKLYVAQIGLQNIKNVLKKIDNRETESPADMQGIKELRERIAQPQRSLQELNKEMTEIGNRLSVIKNLDYQIVYFYKKIGVLNAEMAPIYDELARAQRETIPNRKKIKELEDQVAGVQKILQVLSNDLENAKRTRAQMNHQEQEDRRKNEELERKRKVIRTEISQLQDVLKNKLNSGSSSRDNAAQEKNRLDQQYKDAKTALDATRFAIHEAITGIYADPHPRSAVNRLDDKIPFLLMPVRIETRFMTAGPSPELWLRIYPDDIAIHTHEKLLTKAEISDGEIYWKALFNAEKTVIAEKEDQKKQAWSDLAGSFGSQRAAWIASQTKPLNWKERESFDDTGQLNFRVHNSTKISAWSRAPRAYELPDKFVVMLYEGDTIVKEVTGNIIPDELFVGPDPMEAETSFIKTGDLLEFGEAYDWTSNFEKAIQSGMGFKIPLTTEQASSGFDKILVLGLMISADAEQGQKSMEALIDNHHYSTKGFSFVPQGTPTNNTDQDTSGYTTNDPFNNISYFVETEDTLFDENLDCDGKNFADALGIKYDPLQYIQHSDATDRKEAVAMNTALYASTLGYYFSTLLSPVLPDKAQQQMRDFFIPYVTGRGALPAIRVGDQPYGILLTSDYSKWKWSASETGADNKFFSGLQNVLDYYTRQWNNLAGQVMYTGKPGIDVSAVMMDILGLQSGSVSFQRRAAYTTDDLKNRADMMETEEYIADLDKNFHSKNDVMTFFAGFGYDILDENDKPRVPQLLRLVYQHFSRELNAANLVDDRPLSEKDGIHFFDANTRKNYIHWLAEAESVEVLRRRNFGEGIEAPKSLLFLQMLRSLLVELHAVSTDWLQIAGVNVNTTRAVANFHNIRQVDLTKWEVMKGKVGIAVPAHEFKDKAVADYLLTEGSSETGTSFLNRMKGALSELAGLSTAKLERCFTEHIDTCTYRLDAWQSAFFQRRLAFQRNISSIGSSHPEGRSMGLYIGAFGWLEDIRPSSKHRITPPEQIPGESLGNIDPLFEYMDNGGFVHTPSLNHAMAAAVLRSGYMNHANSAQPETMAVNLSSERVRNAMFILEGIRNGQSLEELLGYQFERGLHDRGSQSDAMKLLNAYIYDFRKKFPLHRHIVLQQGSTTTTETIPATNVVNGLSLAENKDDFPYGATGIVISADDDLEKAVIDEKDKLVDTLDAVKDLLLSESVYQLVQGNFERGAAVMNAMKDSNIPPDIDIVQTPRSSKFTFTNRVTVQFERTDPAMDAGPRGIMEPGLNKWLQTVLGDMEQLAFKVSLADGSLPEDLTVGQLGLQPIDLIYIAGNELNTGSGMEGEATNTAVSELEMRIAHAYRISKALADETPVTIGFLQLEDPTGEKPLGELLPLLRMVKSLITNSRSLHAEDFVPASSELIIDTSNRKGYEPGNLEDRIDQVLVLFDTYKDRLDNANIFLPSTVEGLTGNVTLHELFSTLKDVAKDLAGVSFTLDASHLLSTLVSVSGFGLPDSFPQVSAAITDDKKMALLMHVRSVIQSMDVIRSGVRKLKDDAAAVSDAEMKTGLLVQAGKLLFGDVFNILPDFMYRNGSDIQRSSAERDNLLNYASTQLKMKFVADEWLHNIAHVRPRLANWDGIRTLSEIFTGESLELQPVQLPFRTLDSWVAVEFPEELKPGVPFTIDHDTLSITIHGDGAFDTANLQSGLMIDEIVELIPGKDEITGVAFHYNQPNALPPQALLLAITPEEKGHWDWDALVGIINDTLLRAKQRAVEPDILIRSTDSEIGVLLPAILANFAETDLDLALDYSANVGSMPSIAQ